MIRGGYILQPRYFDQSDAAHLPPVTREVWFFLLRNVTHKDNGKFKRGQGLFSIPDIQKALEWYVGCCPKQYSKTQVAKALRRLREDAMATTTKTTRGSIITILNYAHFQDPTNYEDHSEDATKTLRRTNRDDTINKNGKEVRSNKEPKTFVRPTLEQVTAYCQERGKGVDPHAWMDHYTSNGFKIGGRGAMKDWKAAVRTWERNGFNATPTTQQPRNNL
jgi:hypothetical protein